MWIMTMDGFYSAVEKPWDREDGHLTVRARCREDIDRLVAKLEVDAVPKFSESADYAWRVRVPREAWALYLVSATEDLSYDNFKDETKRRLGRERASVYGSVWARLLDLDDRPDPWSSYRDDDDDLIATMGEPPLPGMDEAELASYVRDVGPVDVLDPPRKRRGKRGKPRR